jgi:exopolysaccharide biosynthesis polyprenyl glycosylphosphotransferase
MHPSARPKLSGWRVRPREQRTLLLIGDLLVAYLALAAAIYAWSLRDQWHFTFFSDRLQTWYYFVPLFWLLLLVELYEPHRANNWRLTVRGILIAALTGLIFYTLIFFLVDRALARIGIGFFLVFASILTLLWRLLFISIFTAPAFMRRVLVIGAGNAGRTLAQAYKNLWPPPFYLVGFIDDDPSKQGLKFESYPVLAGSEMLLMLIEKEAISDLVVAITGEMQGATFQTILDAQDRGVEVIPMPALYEELMGRVPVHHLESEWLIRSFVVEARAGGFYETGKRLLDLLASLVGLGIWLVLYPFIALIILIDSGFPISYSQMRSGKGGRPYRIHKFRTMRQDAEKDGQARMAQESDERVTRVGYFLRRTHLDELPQFWNVLRGEMSMVGPRSERPEWVTHFEKQIPFYRARLLVKPGITGWAQVNYGYVSTVEETTLKLEYDLYYIKHRSILMDLTIILRTVGQMIGFRGR